MAFEQRDNSGSLFRNDKATSDRHPTHKGKAKIGGVEYWISAWIKDGKDGSRFFSLSFEPNEGSVTVSRPSAPARPPAPPKPAASGKADFSDDIPF
jgi:hypothetical protein